MRERRNSPWAVNTLDDFWLDAAQLGINSFRNLRLCIAHHLCWLSDHGKCWRCAVYDDLHRYLGHLVDRNLADATLQVHRWALATLYRWAYRDGHRDDDPVARLAPMKRRPRSLRWVPTIDQIEHILHAPDVHTELGVRDRCILELLYATGMRAGELLGLQAWQADLTSRHFSITGKGGRERLVIYGQAAAVWLRRYISLARPNLIANTGSYTSTSSLFVHPSPNLAMNYTHLWRMVRRCGQHTGYPLLTPHVFRHAFATHCKDAGMDLRTLQTLLGHASIATTTIYLHSSMDQLRAFLEQHHPRGRNYRAASRRRTGDDHRLHS